VVTCGHNHQEIVDLEPIEINLVATNQSERSVAQTKVETLHLANSRSKSKSPTSMRSHRIHRHGTSPPHSGESAESAAHLRPKSSKKSSSRRPHTSSGPTRESKSIFSSDAPLPKAPEPQPPLPQSTPPFPPSSFRLTLKPWSRTSSSRAAYREPGTVADWEKELDRIASQSSKQSADMLRFGKQAGVPQSHASTDHAHGPMSLRPGPAVVGAMPAS